MHDKSTLEIKMSIDKFMNCLVLTSSDVCYLKQTNKKFSHPHKITKAKSVGCLKLKLHGKHAV